MTLRLSDERNSQRGRTHAGLDEPHPSVADRVSPRAARRLLLALGLFFLAPVVAEYLLGNLPITAIYALLVLAPLYGGGALLIREMAVRAQLSWASIVVLALTYGVLEEGITSMSLFNPNYAGERLLDFGYIASLGINGPWTLYVLTLHTVWSIGVPILIMEVLAGEQRTSAWLGCIGLAVTTVLFVFGVVGSTLISIATYHFVASTTQLVAIVMTVLLLIAAAVALGPKVPTSGREHGWRAPGSWVVGAVGFVVVAAIQVCRRHATAIVAALLLAVMLGAATLSPTRVAAETIAQPCTSEQQTGAVPANGISIAYASDGPCAGESVVLIGGTGEQLTEWPTEFVQDLTARGYRVVRFDNRDVGLSTHMTDAGYPDSAAISAALWQGAPPPIPYTLRDMADDSVGLLDALGIARAHLVGASMGGDVAQLVAIDHPDRVLSLTLIGADSGNPALPVIANLEAFATIPPPPADGDKAGFVDYEFATYKVLRSPAYAISDEALHAQVERNVDRACDPAALVRQQTVTLVDHLDPNNYRHANLEHITAPTAIVQGAADPLEPLASAQDLAANIPGAQLFVIPGLGHDVPPHLAPLFVAAIPSSGAPR